MNQPVARTKLNSKGERILICFDCADAAGKLCDYHALEIEAVIGSLHKLYATLPECELERFRTLFPAAQLPAGLTKGASA